MLSLFLLLLWMLVGSFVVLALAGGLRYFVLADRRTPDEKFRDWLYAPEKSRPLVWCGDEYPQRIARDLKLAQGRPRIVMNAPDAVADYLNDRITVAELDACIAPSGSPTPGVADVRGPRPGRDASRVERLRKIARTFD